MRYVRYLEVQDPATAQHTIQRAQQAHCKGNALFQLFAAKFEERTGLPHASHSLQHTPRFPICLTAYNTLLLSPFVSKPTTHFLFPHWGVYRRAQRLTRVSCNCCWHTGNICACLRWLAQDVTCRGWVGFDSMTSNFALSGFKNMREAHRCIL